MWLLSRLLSPLGRVTVKQPGLWRGALHDWVVFSQAVYSKSSLQDIGGKEQSVVSSHTHQNHL